MTDRGEGPPISGEGRADVTDTSTARDSPRVMGLFGEAITGSGVIYALGVGSGVPFALLSLALTTRYLELSEFGTLAILFAIGSVVTVLSGLGVMQGTIMAVYGVSDDEDAESDGVQTDARPLAVVAAERKRLLGSGLLLICLTSTVVCGAVAAGGSVLVAILGIDIPAKTVCLMALSAWTGSVWRLAHQVWRLERRPGVWALYQAARPMVVVTLTLVLLIHGAGIDGVLVATAIGSAIVTIISLGGTRDRFRLEPRRGDAAAIFGPGMKFAPLVIANLIQANAAILLLALIAPSSTVAVYQAARRIAQVPSYFADGFTMGWAPLERSAIAAAAKDRRGIREFEASVFTLLVLGLLALLVVACVSADLLIRIAAPEYREGARLIPIIAVGFAAHAIYQGIYRASSFAHRQEWYAGLKLAWLVPFGLFLLVLTRASPSYAVAVAELASTVLITVILASVERRGKSPTPFPWLRLALAGGVAAALVAFALLAPLPTFGKHLIAVLAISVLPLAWLMAGVLHSSQITVIRRILRSPLPSLIDSTRLAYQLDRVPAHERDALLDVIQTPQEVKPDGGALDEERSIVLARAVRGLRRFQSSTSPPTSRDHEIATYVFSTASTLERDLAVEWLRESGVDPLELHELDLAARQLRRAVRGRAGRAAIARYERSVR